VVRKLYVLCYVVVCSLCGFVVLQFYRTLSYTAEENRYRVGAHCPSVQGLTNASDVCETELLGEVRCDLVEKCITQTLGDISDDERQSFYTCYVTVALFYSLTMVGASTCSTTSGGKGGGLREPSSESASRSCSSSPPS